MKNTVILILVLACFEGNAQSTRERLSLDKGWLFHAGDIPAPVISGQDASYGSSKAGGVMGAAAAKYEDKAWQMVNLPHDWAVEQPFDSTANPVQAYRKRGYGWYRRYFTLAPGDKGKNIELQFDGIATHAVIWVNGTVVHRNFCGSTSAYIDITPLVTYGSERNVIAVQVDAVSSEGWYYEGAGIYRHSWLVKRPPLHVVTDGVFANPTKKPDGDWLLPAEVTIANAGTAPRNAVVEVNVLDRQDKVVAAGTAGVTVPVLEERTARIPITVSGPELWSLEDPALYRVVATVKEGGRTVDELTVKCGFRTIRFTADSGFYLNGKYVQVKGTCNHQDMAGVGVAVPDALWEFRLRRLKELGSNAYRCAHNPPAAELLDACDSLGMLVMDENRNFNTTAEYIRQLQWMVRRDRNHPSVFLWTIFNEEPYGRDDRGYEMARYLSARVKDLDTTRPVTAAQNGGQLNPVNAALALDVAGFNYGSDTYDAFHNKYPGKPMTSSEDDCGLMMRGEYVTDKQKHIVASYDDDFADWGTTHRLGWKVIDQRRYMAGCFVWSGFDYHGEPQPFVWPSNVSLFGIMDLCGFPKTAFWLHQAQWRDDIPVLQLVPHWNWPADSVGKKIRVMALSNADSVVLLLNGKRIGGQKADKYEMNTWWVPYKPGKLEAVGYDKKGRIVSRFATETTDAPYALRLIPYRGSLKNDGLDAMPVTVEVVDRKGRVVPTANTPVRFDISDGAAIIGLGNGDPRSLEPEKGAARSLYNGLAQVIVQSREGSTGSFTLTARAEGVLSVTVTIPLSPVAGTPF